MIDIDRQIENAKKKPLTPENLNHIGDLYVKRGNRQKAVAYFYEAIDRLHFAQKEKKIAIYKKIIKIAPSSEKAYVGIIEILSKMGLVMEEKKYLHLLGRLYEDKGEREKADALLQKVKELDPHASISGSYFHTTELDELSEQGRPAEPAAASADEWGSEEKDEESGGQTCERREDEKGEAAPEVGEESREKLIEASLEEIIEEKPVRGRAFGEKTPARTGRPAFPLKYLLVAVMAVVVVISAILFLVPAISKRTSVGSPQLPVTAVQGDIEVTVTMLSSPDELSGIPRKEISSGVFAALSIKAIKGCIPDAFASSPYTMISFLDVNGTPMEIKATEELQKATRKIYKANVCEDEHGAVFMRIVLPIEKDQRYSGLSIEGVDKNGPILLRWSSR
jgi:hypothetical protein